MPQQQWSFVGLTPESPKPPPSTTTWSFAGLEPATAAPAPRALTPFQPVPSHVVNPLAPLAVAKSPAKPVTFDDSGMTQPVADAWKRVIARYPTASSVVPAIRVNPALRGAKLWAQVAKDNAIEVNPDLPSGQLESVLVHELVHTLKLSEGSAQAAEQAFAASAQSPALTPIRPVVSHAPTLTAEELARPPLPSRPVWMSREEGQQLEEARARRAQATIPLQGVNPQTGRVDRQTPYGGSVIDTPLLGLEQIKRGVVALAQAPPVVPTEIPGQPAPIPKVNQQALSDVIEGAFKAMSVVLPAAALTHPVLLAITLGTAEAASLAGRKAAELAGGGEEAQRLAGNVAALVAVSAGGGELVRRVGRRTLFETAKAVTEKATVAREAGAGERIEPQPTDIVVRPVRPALPAEGTYGTAARPSEPAPVAPTVRPVVPPEPPIAPTPLAPAETALAGRPAVPPVVAPPPPVPPSLETALRAAEADTTLGPKVAGLPDFLPVGAEPPVPTPAALTPAEAAAAAEARRRAELAARNGRLQAQDTAQGTPAVPWSFAGLAPATPALPVTEGEPLAAPTSAGSTSAPPAPAAAVPPSTPSVEAPVSTTAAPAVLALERPTTAPPKRGETSDWTEIGKNAIGHRLYEDQRGVRSYIVNGVRHVEPVPLVPTRDGMALGKPDEERWKNHVEWTNVAPLEPAVPTAPEEARPPEPPETEVSTLFYGFRDRLALLTMPTGPIQVRQLARKIVGGDFDADARVGEVDDAAEAAVTDGFAKDLRADESLDLAAKIKLAQNWEGRLPRARRTLEKSKLQQFSTPLPIATLAVEAAQVRSRDLVLEPTAGTGNLVAAVDPSVARIETRELSPRRAELLRAQGYPVIVGDYLTHLDPANADVIITNPPWGKYTTGKYGKAVGLGFTPGDVGERFIAKNMRDLRDGGRLVAIMPTTMLGPSGGPFRTWLTEHYTVQAIIKSPPGSYDTRATSVDSVLLVVDKVAPTAEAAARAAPSVRVLDTPDFSAYIAAVERIPDRAALHPSVRPAAGRAPTTPEPVAVSGAGGVRGQRGGSRTPGERTTPPVAPGRHPAVVAPAPGPERGGLAQPPRTPTGPVVEASGDPTRGLSDDALKAYRVAEGSQHFAPYRLRTSTLRGVRHPKLVVEARSLAGVPYPSLTYEPGTRFKQIVAAGRVSLEQADQAIAALQANLVGHHGFLTADNVGVGKSREIALAIVEAMDVAQREGREFRLLVTTKSADNIADLIDKELLQDVLAGEDPGFEIVRVSDLKAAKKDIHSADFQPLPRFPHALYVTDSYNLAPYREALQAVGLHGIVGDEAHRFKNSDAAVGATWQTLHAQIYRDVPRNQQFFSYFTATPAQSVTDYEYLYGLRLWPLDGFDQWIDVVTGHATEETAKKVAEDAETGGQHVDAIAGNTGPDVVGGDSTDTVHQARSAFNSGGNDDVFLARLTPAEAEQIPREWKALGRFSARDLWRQGTEFEVHTAHLATKHKAKYDEFAQLARDISAAVQKFGAYDRSGRRSRFGVAGMLQFAAKRVQMQPAIEEAVRLARRAVDQGYQPVLSLINVNEMNPEEGNIGAAIDQVNTRMIDRTDDGEIVDMGEIPESLIRIAELKEQAAALGVFENPLDLITQEFGEDHVAFVIGGAGRSRQAQVAEFQAGKRQVAVISAAGATGISIDHRVVVPGGEEGRRFFIDVQYEWSASEALQRYGRVDRASSLTPPKIVALTFGSAAEKKFLATIANRMAATGALSRGGSETTGATALEEFEITGQDSLIAARDAFEQLDEADRDYFIGRFFRDMNHPEHPARTTRASMKQIQLALLWLPTDVAERYWDLFLTRRATIREQMGYADELRAAQWRGEVLRSITLSPTLTIHQVISEAKHRFGILQGVVMPEMPKIRHYLEHEGGEIKRRYGTFTVTGGTALAHGETVVAGLEVPWTRVNAMARAFGKHLEAEKLDTPEKVREALRVGERVEVQSPSKPAWKLRQRQDGRVTIEGAKMADRDLLLRHGGGYSPVGNFWFVNDLEKFLERFPAAEPKFEPETGGGGEASIGRYAEEEVGAAGARSPGGTATIQRTVETTIHPIEFPELVDLARDLQATPKVVKAFRKPGKMGEFRPGHIRLSAELFQKGNEVQLAATLAHEIGHLADWLPEGTLKRGNLIGRLRSLQGFLKWTFTKEDETIIKNPELKAELTALSDAWRPWDPKTASAGFTAYRHSSKELFADAISVLLNDPARLEVEAPIFFREFFDAIDAKPEVERAYFDLQEVLSGTREDLVVRRRTGVRRMFETGDITAIEIERRRQRERNLRRRDVWFRLKLDLVDNNYRVIDKVRALEKQGIRIPEDDDPRYLLEERNYLGGKLKGFTERSFAPIYERLLAADVDWTTFGETLLYNRIVAGDRSELANPRGLSLAAAREASDHLRAHLTPVQRGVVDDALAQFREAVTDVAERAYREGLYTPELHAQMEENPAYATYQVIEHLEDGVTSRVHRQIGTLKDIVNPADATMLKTLVTLRAIEHNRVKRTTVEMLAQHYPAEIADAKTMWTGKGHRPLESRDPNQKLVTYFAGGHLVGKYVDPYIATSLANDTVGHGFALLNLLQFANSKYFRPIFTTFNLGFQSFNLIRDFLRFWKNVPGLTIGRAVARYVKAAPLARVRAFGLRADPTATQRDAYEALIQAEESAVLSATFNDLIQGRAIQDTQVEDILARTGVGGYHLQARQPWAKPVLWLLDRIKDLGDFIETLPKAGAIYEFKGDGPIDSLTPSQRSFIRRKVGSPDFLAHGKWTPVTNNVFLFSNAMVQAVRADFEVATQPRTRSGWWWKTAKINLLPKVLMWGALMGIFGETLRRLMQRASEYDRTNYSVLPLGEDAEGNTIYLRVPQDDTGRLVGGIFWKALQLARKDPDAVRSLTQVLDYTAGQIPNVMPGINAVASTVEFLGGRNVYDPFRGRFVFTDDELAARDWSTVKKFVGWEFQQLGGGIVWKFYPGEARPRAKTVGQQILDAPILSNIVGRFIRITAYGETEQLRVEQQKVQRDEARRRQRERAAVSAALEAYVALPKPERTPARVLELARQVAHKLYVKPEEYSERFQAIRTRMRIGAARGGDDPLVDAVLSATTTAQKVAVILAASAVRSETDLTEWLQTASQEGAISAAVVAEVKAQRAKPAQPVGR